MDTSKPVKTVKIPINGPIEHNFGPYVAIGQLVITWANNESVFMAMMQCLLPGEDTPQIIWYSHPNTKARLELLDRLVRDRVTDKTLIEDIQRAIKNFKGQTRVRNFFCHAIYSYDQERRLIGVTGMEVTQEGEPIKAAQKPIDPATMNEIISSTGELNRLNLTLWKLVERLQAALGVQRVEIPSLFLKNLQEEGHQAPSGDERPPEPPQASGESLPVPPAGPSPAPPQSSLEGD